MSTDQTMRVQKLTVDVEHIFCTVARPSGILANIRVLVAASTTAAQLARPQKTRTGLYAKGGTDARAEQEPSVHEHCWPFSGHQLKRRHQRPAARWMSSQRAFHPPMALGGR